MIRNDQNYTRNQSGRYRGKGGRWNNNNMPKYQICEKTGHTASKCYFWFDSNYNSSQSSANQRNNNPNANMESMQHEQRSASEEKRLHNKICMK